MPQKTVTNYQNTDPHSLNQGGLVTGNPELTSLFFGGPGGSILVIGNLVNNTGDVTAIGGIGFTPLNIQCGNGGDGAVGRIRISAATINGVTIPAAYTD